jgi:hypothetical protein
VASRKVKLEGNRGHFLAASLHAAPSATLALHGQKCCPMVRWIFDIRQ